MTFQSPDEPNSIEEDVRRQFNKSEEKEAPGENLFQSCFHSKQSRCRLFTDPYDRKSDRKKKRKKETEQK